MVHVHPEHKFSLLFPPVRHCTVKELETKGVDVPPGSACVVPSALMFLWAELLLLRWGGSARCGPYHKPQKSLLAAC